MATALLFLSVYWGLIFRHDLANPYWHARGELLEQGFPSSVLLGRRWGRGRFPSDDGYYPDYAALPFLSSVYPPHVLQAVVGEWLSLSLNHRWILFRLTMVAHFWLCSVSCWILLSSTGTPPLPALCGAVSLSSLGYAMKPNSSIVYTLTWVPVFILSSLQQSTLLTGISLGMMLLAGYWPIALPALGLGLCCWLWA